MPALTAIQVVRRLACDSGDDVLIQGAGGVTGGLLVAFAAPTGRRVVATCSSRAAARVRHCGASDILNYRAPDWQARARARRGTASPSPSTRYGVARQRCSRLLADGGRLATITGDPPKTERDILVVDAYVAPDGPALEAAVAQLVARGLSIPIAGTHGLGDAAGVLHDVTQGHAQGASVLDPQR